MTTRIDIVSDVVCPWCVIGYLRLEKAVKELKTNVEIFWHPFELNSNMPSGGENLRAHLIRKYGITTEASVEARTRLLQLGEELGFEFKYSDKTRIFNTLKIHQLLHFARKHQKEHILKLLFFKAYFTDLKELDQDEVLVEIGVSVGLAEDEIRQVLKEDLHRDEVKAEISFYMEQGLRGVPAFIFDQKYLVSGAQDIEMFKNILEKVASENLSAVE